MDPSILLQIIWNNIRNNDNQLRKRAENKLFDFFMQSPDELVNYFVDILQIPPNNPTLPTSDLLQVKSFVMVQLNNCLSRHPRPPYKYIWPDLDSQTQKRIKLSFFRLLKIEEDLSMMKMLAGTLGRLAANLIIANEQPWPQFKPLLLDVFLHCSQAGVRYGFYILESFYSEEENNFKDIVPELYHLLETGLLFASHLIQIGALRCFKSYLLVLDHCNHSKYQHLIPTIFQSVNETLLKGNTNAGLIILSDMLEYQAKFFKPFFKEMIAFFVKLYKSEQITSSERSIIIEILADYCNNYPSLFKKSKDAIPLLLDMIVMYMLSEPIEITEKWTTPEEGFDQSYSAENSNSVAKYGMDLINGIIREVEAKVCLPQIEKIIESLASVNNIQYHYNALMIIGILGEHMEEVQDAEKYLENIINALQHENPLLRFAGCHAIALLADDLRPKFQEKYGVYIFQRLMKRLLEETVPRVIGHIQASLCNLIEGATFDLILPYFDQFSQIILKNANTGISLVKESAMNLLTHLVQISGVRFSPYLETFFFLVNEYFNSERYMRSCYNGLRGSALETMSYMSTEIPRQDFEPYIKPFIELVISIPSRPSKYQPAFRQIINTWQRLCILYSLELEYNVDRFLPQIFETLDSCIADGIVSQQPSFPRPSPEQEENEGQDEQEQQQKQSTQNSYRTQLISDGIGMFKTFSDLLPSLTTRYLQETIELLSNLVRNYPEQSVKEDACKALPKIVRSIVCEDIRTSAAKTFISDLLTSFQQNRQTCSSYQKIFSIHRIIEDLSYRFFTLQELKILTDKLTYHLQFSEKQKQNLFKESQQMDEDELQNVNVEIELEQSIQFNIVEVFGDIFKIYEGSATYLARELLNSMLVQVLLHSQRQTPIRTAIFIIDDIVQHVGYSIMSQEWPSFEIILKDHLRTNWCSVRQASAYGLGVLAEQTPFSLRNEEAALNWMECLSQTLNIDKKKSDKLVSFLHARDNIVAAMGKVMRSHLNIIDIQPYLPVWLLYLPLKKDRRESEEQTHFLLQLLLERPHLILKEPSIERMVRLMNILGDILKNKLVSQEMFGSIYKVIEKLVAHEFFIKNMDVIMSNTNDIHREAIWNLVSNPPQS